MSDNFLASTLTHALRAATFTHDGRGIPHEPSGGLMVGVGVFAFIALSLRSMNWEPEHLTGALILNFIVIACFVRFFATGIGLAALFALTGISLVVAPFPLFGFALDSDAARAIIWLWDIAACALVMIRYVCVKHGITR